MSYFAFSVFLSAFLLFQIQPMTGKYMLPWFGGASAVWSATMLFFMALLTGGYAYACWLINTLSEKKQGIVHMALIGASLGLLLATGTFWSSPITPGDSWKPQGSNLPIWDIFRALAASVGMPYFILATNGPLMQAWFSRSCPGRSPYRLYALSNVGSLLALISYPVLIEPALALKTQASVWSGVYVVFAACAMYGASMALRGRTTSASQPSATHISPQATADMSVGLGRSALWIALPACASIMLLATTSQMTQNVAAIPFLWVLPLTIYLLSFILCFSTERAYSRPVYSLALMLTSGLYVWVDRQGIDARFWLQIAAYSLLLFVCCMVCHGELARLKPHPRHLTSYYLMISIGGAVGGIAVSLIAPYVFTGFWELPVGLFGCWTLLVISDAVSKPSLITIWFPTRISVGVVCALFVMGSVFFVHYKEASANALLAWRNFYGVLQVSVRNADDPQLRAYRLYHGVTLHGIQYAADDKRRLPTAYYTEENGVGLALLNHPKRPGPLRVGVLGLGIGTLAAYGQTGDVFRFYEINPAVVHTAEGLGGYFTYLKDCPARVEVVLGDARISLEKEVERGERQQFDLLVLDTFNSDAVPVHLLTLEAFGVYLQHLQPDGILALHISNRYLNLRPVIWGLADYFHLATSLIETGGDDERRSPSVWMLATRNTDFLNRPPITTHSTPRQDTPYGTRLWTDDYSNLFQVLY